MLKKNFEYDEEVETAAKDYFDSLEDAVLQSKEFSNGRFVRNLFERTWAKAAMRREMGEGKLRVIKDDFLRSIADSEFKKSRLISGGKKIGFGSMD